MDAPRARSRPPPPPRRPPLTAAIAAIPAPVTNATLVAITASDCATIDATLASTIAPSRRPARARAHLGPSPPPPPSISKAHRRHSRHPRRRHRPCRHLDRNLRLCRAWRRVWEGLMALPPPHGHGSARQRSRPSLAPMCKNNNNRYCGSFLNKLLSPKWRAARARCYFSPPRARDARAASSVVAHTRTAHRAAGSGSRCASYRLLSMDPLSYERK